MKKISGYEPSRSNEKNDKMPNHAFGSFVGPSRSFTAQGLSKNNKGDPSAPVGSQANNRVTNVASCLQRNILRSNTFLTDDAELPVPAPNSEGLHLSPRVGSRNTGLPSKPDVGSSAPKGMSYKSPMPVKEKVVSNRNIISRSQTTTSKIQPQLKQQPAESSVRPRLQADHDDNDDGCVEVITMIRKMFGYNPKNCNSNDNFDKEMEAIYNVIMKEEKESANRAKQDEERKLEEKKSRERKRKLEAKLEEEKMRELKRKLAKIVR